MSPFDKAHMISH